MKMPKPQATRKPRGPYKRRTAIERVAILFDRCLLHLLREGRPCFDGNGQPVVDKAGIQLYKPPAASDLQIIRQRLADCNMAGERGQTESTGDIIERIRARGNGNLKLAGSNVNTD